ncbi:hypothetical protein [Caballeronia sp. KNU42]
MARVAKQDFTLTRDDCRPLYFVTGQDIPAEYENHWFVLHHTDEAPVADVETDEKRKPGRPAKA